MQVDAVDQRAGKAALIIRGAADVRAAIAGKPGSLARPQRQGFIAATSMKRAGYVMR